MSKIKLDLSIDEANLVLEGLGNLPFAKVFALIAKIQEQASQQLNGEMVQNEVPQTTSPPEIKQEMTHAE